MNFEYFDIHSHLYFKSFDLDREVEIKKIKEAKIGAITVGVDFETSEQAIGLAEKHDNLFATVGFHPGDVELETVFDEKLTTLAEHKKVVAIGECGLDYFRLSPELGLGFKADKALATIANQKKIFQSHIDLALKLDKPLMLHIRPSKGTMDAYLDALEILENQQKLSTWQVDNLLGNVHFFVGDLEVLERFLALGFTVSFTGVITFTHYYDEVILAVPLDMIMSETDAPLVPPVPYRGQRNSPMYVLEVVKRIAEIRGESLEIVQRQLVKNVKKTFGLG